MPLSSIIVDPGTNSGAEVRERTVMVSQRVTSETVEEVAQVKVFAAFFTDSAGSQDLTIDGATTPTEFQIRADTAEAPQLREVIEVRFVLQATNMNINGIESRRFGPTVAPGLTNGLRFFAFQNGITTELFTTPVTNIGEFYRYSGGDGAAVADGLVNLVDAVAVGTDLLVVQYILPAPVKLYPGSIDCICVMVQDDLSAAGFALFEVQGTGRQVAV